jgi:hypothetical protein
MVVGNLLGENGNSWLVQCEIMEPDFSIKGLCYLFTLTSVGDPPRFVKS